MKRIAVISLGAGLLLTLGGTSSLAAPRPPLPSPWASFRSVPTTVRPTDQSVKIKVGYLCVNAPDVTYTLIATIHQPTGVFDANGVEYTGLYSAGGGIPGTGPQVYAKCTGKEVTQTLTVYSHDEYFRLLDEQGVIDITEPPSIQEGEAFLHLQLVDAVDPHSKPGAGMGALVQVSL